MLIKFITRSIRPLGMFLIFLFAVFSIFSSMIVRNIDRSTALGKFLEYTISFENRFYDFRMKDQMDGNFKSKDIVLVKIDDYSLQKLGTWPIPRTEYAKMLDKLSTFGASVVGMDIMFPEKSSPTGGASPDEVFADAIRRFQARGKRVFVAYTLASQAEEHLPEAPLEMLNDAVLTQNAAGVDLFPKRIARYTFPIPELLSSEVGLANISNIEDPDGIFRHYQLISNVDTIYYGSLGLSAYEAHTGNKPTIKISEDRTAELEIEGRKLEITPDGEVKIRYKGGSVQFPEMSLYELLGSSDDDQKMKEFFDNKIVFVGSTAAGAHDLRPSPIDAKMPGVYSHINTTHMLLNRHFYQSTNDSVMWSLLILVVGMMVYFIAQYFQNAILNAVTVAGTVGLAYYLDQQYFLPEGYELKLFYCFFGFTAVYSWSTFWEFYEASKEKKQIKGTFARYVAPTVVDEMLKHPDKLQVGGTKMDITCLFSDVRDFTTISETLSAMELAHSLNLYMGKMTDIVFDTRGTLDKYIGDAIVALWGAPLPIGNHAQHAVEAAMLMMESMPEINRELKDLGRPEFKVGIGLNSGECSVGNMGSHRIFSYTALGDNMNLGARLESLCKHYGAQILISEYTLERIDTDQIKTRLIDKVIVKGKTTPVGVYEVIHGEHAMARDPEALNFYLTAHQLFQKKNFQAAMDIFNQLLLSLENDLPSKRFRDLCRKYLEQPELVTENFEVTKMTEK